MGALRTPFQGVSNILRFNWHFYLLAAAGAVVLIVASARLEGLEHVVVLGAVGLVGATILVSLLVSWYVYDLSGFYRLEWIDGVGIGPAGPGAKMANIHAGFDETSALLRARYPGAAWTVMDFYDPGKHTEVSIRRARRAFPPAAEDVRVDTSDLAAEGSSMDAVFVLLAAHEIRDVNERYAFFRELHRVLKPSGRVILVEHLRDGRNFVAYTVGAFHFIGRRAWLEAFEHAKLHVAETVAPNPFLTCFVLRKSGNAP